MTALPRWRRRGVSFLELVVVLGLLLLAAAILLPFVFRVRQAASATNSLNNQRQLGLAAHNFHDSHNMFPPAVGDHPKGSGGQGTAHFYLLPYLEQDNVFRMAENQVWKNGTHSVVIRVFLHPDDKSAPPNNQYKGWLATTNYPANWMLFRDGDKRIQDVADGTSNTLMFAERYQVCNGTPTGWGYAQLYPWAPIFAYYTPARYQVMPKQDECDPTLAQSIGPGGLSATFCDGSVRHIADSVSPRTWMHLCDPADGNPLLNDF